MKNIEDLVNNQEKFQNATIQKKFKSKKNTVAYVTIDQKPRVLKWFVPGLYKNMENEYKILSKGAKDLDIPSVFEKDDENNVLVLSYITGENLCDLINSEEITYQEKQRLMILLAQWFNKFHSFFKEQQEFKIMGDPELRNFIFTNKIFGVDFEETRKGHPVEDIAGMCASILSTDPSFTKTKFKLCEKFIDEYTNIAPGRILNINDEIAYSLLKKIQWRPQQEETLRKYSKRIKEHGLK